MSSTSHYIPEKLYLTPTVLTQIKETIGSRKAETGGILGGNRTTGEVTHFCFDEDPQERSGVAYTPNITVLNKVIKSEWKPRGIEFLGSVHSHPPFHRRPSPGDEFYAQRILKEMELPYLLVAIVMSVADTDAFSFLPFAAVSDGGNVRVIQQELIVGGEEVVPAEHDVRQDALPWELLAILGGAGLVTYGVLRGLQHLPNTRKGKRT